MIVARDIYKQINHITSKLIEEGLCMDQNFPSYTEGNNSIEEIDITAKRFLNNSNVIMKDISYKEMYTELCDARLFNMKMIDGALIQMQYRFSENKLEKHRLAFFPAPDLECFQSTPSTYLEDCIYNDILDKRVVTVPIRFDYDDSVDVNGNKVSKPVEHPISHLTIGQYKNCRIPVTSAITPYQFIGFLIRNFYNTSFKCYDEWIFNEGTYFSSSIYEEEKGIIHICSLKY